MNITNILFAAVFAFAAGVMVTDVAHDHSAHTQQVTSGTVKRTGLTRREADLLCAHYHAVGEGYKCDTL